MVFLYVCVGRASDAFCAAQGHMSSFPSLPFPKGAFRIVHNGLESVWMISSISIAPTPPPLCVLFSSRGRAPQPSRTISRLLSSSSSLSLSLSLSRPSLCIALLQWKCSLRSCNPTLRFLWKFAAPSPLSPESPVAEWMNGP